MKRHLIIQLIAVLLPMLGALLPGAPLHAQVRGAADTVDSALDLYAAICNRCLEMKSLAAAGNAVPPDEFQALLQELSALKTTLQGSSGEMTDAQRSRFLAIRDSYAAGRHYDDSAAKGGGDNKVALKNDSLPAARADSLSQQPMPAAQPPSLSDKGMVNFALMASAGLWPDQTYGLMGVLDRGRWGAFLRGRSNFRYRHSDYSCQASDGTTPYGYIWTTGNSDRVLTSVTAGGVYNIIDKVSFYAGAGYGHMNLFWEDAAGKWALVEDLSGGGLAADAGILLQFGSVTAGIGVTSFAFRYANMEVSLGWRF